MVMPTGLTNSFIAISKHFEGLNGIYPTNVCSWISSHIVVCPHIVDWFQRGKNLLWGCVRQARDAQREVERVDREVMTHYNVKLESFQTLATCKCSQSLRSNPKGLLWCPLAFFHQKCGWQTHVQFAFHIASFTPDCRVHQNLIATALHTARIHHEHNHALLKSWWLNFQDTSNNNSRSSSHKLIQLAQMPKA